MHKLLGLGLGVGPPVVREYFQDLGAVLAIA